MMQTDVKSKEIDASGLLVTGPTRIRGAYVVADLNTKSVRPYRFI